MWPGLGKAKMCSVFLGGFIFASRICDGFSFFSFLLYCLLLFFCFYFGDSLASDKGGSGLGKWVWGKQEYVAAFFATDTVTKL